MNAKTIEKSDDQRNLTLLRATVRAKIAYWDALSALEAAIVPDGEIADRGTDYIEALAANSTSNGSDVDLSHLNRLLSKVAA